MTNLEYFLVHADIQLPQGWTNMSRGLLEYGGVFLQLRVSREKGCWGAPFLQMGFTIPRPAAQNAAECLGR